MLEKINKWLHSETKDGQVVIDILINMGMGDVEFNLDNYNFKNIVPPITNKHRIKDALNEYFNEHDYPFEARYDQRKYKAYIVKTRPLSCLFHKKILTTESELIEHLECRLKHNFISRTEQEIHSENIFIENENPTTIKSQKKKKQEEIKAKRDF